jgi:hypothetical protein
MPAPAKLTRDFFLWDYDSTLFPLRLNRVMADRFSSELMKFIQSHMPGGPDRFQQQHRVFATKRGWFLRPTLKLDPAAEFFFYDFVRRNQTLFNDRAKNDKRLSFGYRFSQGDPIPILKSYSGFKKASAKFRNSFKSYVYFDVSAYFNRIYHHDLVAWCEKAGASTDDVHAFGKFLREIVGGRSINCLPQGIYPAKMVGAAFLNCLEESVQITCAQSVRMMDDVWFFDNEKEKLVSDFLVAQSLLNERGLTVNEKKSAILEGHDTASDLPADLDEIKIDLLRKRREELAEAGGYADEFESEADDTELTELTSEEQEYLLSLLTRERIEEEDAELVLTLMRNYCSAPR